MSEIKKQIELINQIKLIRSRYQQLKLSRLHYDYLLTFSKQYRWLISGLIVLLIAQGIIEAVLIVFSRDQLSSQQKLLIAPLFWQFLVIVLVIFFTNSYFSIRWEKTLGVQLANSIRRRLLRSHLDQPLSKMDQEKKADLIAKIAYQVPLVSMGITNVFFGTLRWLVYILVATLISFLSGLNWIFVLCGSLVISVIVAIVAYFIAKKYISQEVTFYSQIIKQIDINTSERHFLKIFNQENAFLNKFDRLVDFDSFFRIRRDLWMRMGVKVVFAILIIFSVMTHFFSVELFTKLNSLGPETKFLFLFLMIYFSRAINESLRMGLYFYPARLGLFLTILKPSSFLHKGKELIFVENINFYSRKFKLFKEGKHYRHLNLIFSKSGRYLFFSSKPIGKTSLARLLSGLDAFNPKAVKIKVDGQRLDYSTWSKFGKGICFFDPNFYSAKSLMEIALGRDKETTDFADIETASEILRTHQLIASLITPDSNFNSSSEKVFTNKSSAFALYAWHCLVNKPELIVIDNIWIDLKYEAIIRILEIIDRELPQSTIIIFSRENNDYLNYSQKYDMDQEI